MKINTAVTARVAPAILAYSFETHRMIDESLFIDMIRDILTYARDQKLEPSNICSEISVTNKDSCKEIFS